MDQRGTKFQASGEGEVAWQTKADAAYYRLRDRVIDGRLAPGSNLDQEALARQIGLSTTPVREALRRLEADGLVIQKAHSTIRVPELSKREFNELYGIRMLLDPEAARLACRSADRVACDAVRSILRTAEAEEESEIGPLDRLRINRRFHRAIYARCGSDTMVTLLDTLWDRCDRYRLQLLKDDEVVDVADAQHHDMLEAFCDGKEDLLAQLVREHLQGSYDRLIDLLSQ